VDQLALAIATRTTLLDVDALQHDGTPIYAPEPLYYYGISQGHILGGTYVALSPHVARAVLGVGGASFPLMMSRARPFGPFLALVETLVPDPIDVQELVAQMAPVLARIDPITYAPWLQAPPWPDAPAARRILMHAGIGDVQVPNLATELHARAAGLSLLVPAPHPVAGLPEATDPGDGIDTSALVEVDFGLLEDPTAQSTIPTTDNCVHETVRTLPEINTQIDLFLQPNGRIHDTCEGICTATCPPNPQR